MQTLVLYTSLTTLALSILAYLLTSHRRNNNIVAKLPLAPFQDWSFWWGHEYAVANNEVDVKYSQWGDLLGSVYRIKAALSHKDVVVVIDHTAVQYIFDHAYTFLKAQIFQASVVRVVGRGVVWAESEEHKFQRKMISPAFTPSAVKDMAEGVFECAQKTVNRIISDIDEAQGGGVRNLSTYIPPCTLEVIGRIGFNYDFSYITPEAQSILNAWAKDVAKFRTFTGFLAPVLISIFPWITKLPIAALHEDTMAKTVIHRVGRKLLEQPVNPDGKDIFSILVRESWMGKDRDSKTAKLNDSQLLDNILTFFIAGFETTAGAVSFTLLDLAQHSEKQHKLREELFSSDLTPETIESLPYLDAVAREGLRLHAIAGDTHRVALSDDIIPIHKPITLSNGKVVTSIPVKAGDTFTIPYTSINTNLAVWGPNGRDFVPERWLEPGGVPEGKDAPHGPFSNITTFADGPRMCIGWRLAVMEMKIILALMVKNFEFKDSGADIKKFASPTVQPFVGDEAATLPIHISLVQHTK